MKKNNRLLFCGMLLITATALWAVHDPMDVEYSDHSIDGWKQAARQAQLNSLFDSANQAYWRAQRNHFSQLLTEAGVGFDEWFDAVFLGQ